MGVRLMAYYTLVKGDQWISIEMAPLAATWPQCIGSSLALVQWHTQEPAASSAPTRVYHHTTINEMLQNSPSSFSLKDESMSCAIRPTHILLCFTRLYNIDLLPQGQAEREAPLKEEAASCCCSSSAAHASSVIKRCIRDEPTKRITHIM